MRLRPVIWVALEIFILCCGIGVREASGLELRAKVVSVSGSVEVMSAGSGLWHRAANGESLGSGDRIKTGGDGRCAVTWAGGNAIALDPMTSMTVEKMVAAPEKNMESHLMSLEKGRLYSRVKKLSGYASEFKIRTPSAVAGVRGTKLAVEVGEDGATTVECHGGEVVVVGLAGGEVALAPGKGTRVEKGGTPAAPMDLDESRKEAFSKAAVVGVPALVLIDPPGSVETVGNFLMVHGRTDAGAGVTVNGAAAEVSAEGFFTVLLMGLKEGENPVEIKAGGPGGETVRTLTVTSGGPGAAGVAEKYTEESGAGDESGKSGAEAGAGGEIGVSVTYPPDGFVTGKSELTITGRKTPGTKLYFGGAAEPVAPGAAAFSRKVFLDDEGENLFTILVERGGESKTLVHKIIRDTTPPALEIFRPANGRFDIMTGDCGPLPAGFALGDFLNCNIVGMTEPDAALIIDDVRYEVGADGSFDNQVALDPRDPVLLVAAEDQAGNRTIKVLTRILLPLDETVYMEPPLISPVEIMGDLGSLPQGETNEAVVTVECLNYLRLPVDGISVILEASYGTWKDSSGGVTSVTLVNGKGTATYVAGITDVRMPVTITAVSGTVAASAVLELKPRVPCDLENPACNPQPKENR